MKQTLKLITLALLTSLSSIAENSGPYPITGHFAEINLECSPTSDQVPVYDAGKDKWTTATRTWTYPSARYGYYKKAHSTVFPYPYYPNAIANAVAGVPCDTHYRYWTTWYWRDSFGVLHTEGYWTNVDEVQIYNVPGVTIINYNVGPLNW
jgi:hypothetical protein